MAERKKKVRDLKPGDSVQILLGGFARIVSCNPSQCTMVKPPRAGPNDPPAVGLIVVYELSDGPKRGLRAHMVLHPDQEVKI